MSTRTLIVSHPDCARHDTGPGHPERAQRLEALLAAVDSATTAAGADLTLNLPVPPGLPATRYVEELQRGLEVALARLSPDIIFISAGFDAAAGDPLAGLTLRPADYHSLTRALAEIAQSHCDGRVVSVLEGGYDLANLTRCGLAHVQALADLDLS
jgi:acetoin utilization deacetylase AcuC-like enzyme